MECEMRPSKNLAITAPPLWMFEIILYLGLSVVARRLCDSGLLRQGRIGEPFIQCPREHRVNALERMISAFTLIQSKCELVDVPLQMLRSDVMIDSVHPALHDGPHRLNGVGVGIAINKSLVLCFTVLCP